MSPLFRNDPLLIAISTRWALSPLTVFYWSLLLFPLLLLAWAAASSCLRIRPSRENPDGHGLLSPINAYVLLVPLLNYAIFDYYDAYTSAIKGLFASGVLAGTFEEFGAVFASPVVIGVTLFGYAIGLLLAILFTVWHWKWRKRPLTNWLFRVGKPRPIAWYFNVIFFGLELAIVFNWVFRHIIIWWRLDSYIVHARTVPLHPDEMFGLGRMSDLVGHSLVVITITTLLATVWLVGSKITIGREVLLRNPGHLATLVSLVLLGPVIVILPLTVAHTRMEIAKHDAQQIEGDRVVEAANVLQAAILGRSGSTEGLIKAYEAQQKLYAAVDRASTWPLTVSATGTLPIAFLSPLLVPLLVEFAKRLADRYYGPREGEIGPVKQKDMQKEHVVRPRSHGQ